MAAASNQLNQLVQIDKACLAFESAGPGPGDLDDQRLRELATAYDIADLPSLLCELLAIEWEGLNVEELADAFQSACQTWPMFAGAIEKARQTVDHHHQLRGRSAGLKGLSSGTCLGHYRVVRKIGSGGMGNVYAAEDPRLGRQVAIKILSPHLISNANFVQRLAREATAIARLSHPNVVTLYDLGQAQFDGQQGAFVVMELLEGKNLRERLDQGAIEPQAAISIATDVARALAAAHAKGVVHRDIKPENIFLTNEGRVKILDFGLAQLQEQSTANLAQPNRSTFSQQKPRGTTWQTQVGTVMGTSGYMSPEQVRGLPASPSSDLFSLSCILFEMLTGQRAFDGQTRADLATATLRDDPLSAQAESTPALLWPIELVELLRKGLSKNQADRIQHAEQYITALLAVQASIVDWCRKANEQERPSMPSNSDHRSSAGSDIGMRTDVWHKWLKLTVLSACVMLVIWMVGLRVSLHSDRPSVAVLPFSTQGATHQQLANTLTLALTDALASRSQLSVRPYSSVAHWHATNDLFDDSRIQKLKVEQVVTGQVSSDGKQLVARVELVDMVERRLTWSQTYHAPAEGLLGLENQIQSDVARHLSGQMAASGWQQTLAFNSQATIHADHTGCNW